MFKKTNRLSLQELIQSSDKGYMRVLRRKKRIFQRVIKVTSIESYIDKSSDRWNQVILHLVITKIVSFLQLLYFGEDFEGVEVIDAINVMHKQSSKHSCDLGEKTHI